MENQLAKIWNRAALENGGISPGSGDRHLAALLLAHGLVMNGGVTHAASCLDAGERNKALIGYEYFGFTEVCSLFTQVVRAIEAKKILDKEDEYEQEFDNIYYQLILSDSDIESRFKEMLIKRPMDFNKSE